MSDHWKAARRIVLVDDEPDFHRVVRHWLWPRYELVSLMSGESLLDALAGLDCDLLILDAYLPGEDGFQLCRRVRADGRFGNMRILFLTASRNEADFIRGFEAGASVYLTKPIDRKELLLRIGQCLPDKLAAA